MIPILYNKEERQFRSYGLGLINDMISPEVRRERHGQYFLYFQYPNDAEFSSVFEEEMKIKADAGVRTPWQTFEITRVKRRTGHLIEVEAKHISQTLTKDALSPRVSINDATAEQALRTWNINRVGDRDFDVWSDIDTRNSTSWSIADISNAFEALAGRQGSILDTWGGDFEFDNNLIRLHRQMGRETPVTLEYGRNIIGVEQEKNEQNVYTSIYPYALYTPPSEDGRTIEQRIITLPELYIDGKYIDMHDRRKISVVDFTTQFEPGEEPTQAKLRSLANQYLEANEIGALHENVIVEYVDLSKTLDYQDYQFMEEVELNDRVPVFYPDFDILDQNARVIAVVYNPVKEENKSIEIGIVGQSFRNRITSGINDRLERLANKQARFENDTVPYLINGQGNRIWYLPPDEDIEHKIGDVWFEENGQYTRIRVWNGSQWIVEIDTEDVDKVARQVAQAQSDIIAAQETADEAVERINTDIAGKFTSLDEEIATIEGISNTAEANAQAALNQSLDAIGDASLAITNAQTAVDRADSAISSIQDISVEIDEINGTLDLKADNSTVNALGGTVSELSTEVGIMAGELNAKADSSTVDTISGIVDSHTVNIQANADALKLKANQDTVDTLAGTVSSLGTDIGVVAGKISSKVWSTDIETAIDDTTDIIDAVESELTQKYDSITATVSSVDGRVATNKLNLDGLTTTVQSVRTDLEGTTTLLNTTVTTVNGHTSSISTLRTDVNGKATTAQFNTLTSTVNGTISRVGDAEGKITQIETNVSGLQTTVASKAAQSQVTQLANSLSSTITAVGNIDVLPTDNGTGKTFRNVYSYTNSSSSVNGMLRINTPITSPYMTMLRITGYNYLTNNSNIDLTISFYAYSTGAILQHSYSNKGDYKIDYVRVGRDSSGRIVVFIGRTNNNWRYASINVETVKLSFNNPPDSYKNGWSATVTTSTSGISNLTTLNGMDMQSSITQNANNINLRVEKGELLSQINIEAERTLIQSNKLLLNANNTVITGTAWMDGAVIANASIDGAKIQDATIGSAKIASLDVGKISGNISNFIQSNWDTIYSSVNITGNSVGMMRSTSGGYAFEIANNEARFDVPTSIYQSLDMRANNLIFGTNMKITANNLPGNWIYIKDRNNSNIMEIGDTIQVHRELWMNLNAINLGGGQSIASPGNVIRFLANNNLRLSVSDSAINAYTTLFTNSNIAMNGNSVYFGTSANIWAPDGNAQLQFNTGGIRRMLIGTNNILIYRHTSMEGHNLNEVGSINYRSDERLKDILGDRTEDDLSTILSINYKNYIMDGRKQRGFIAQELQQIDSDLINVDSNEYLSYDGQGYVHTIGHAVQQLAFRELNTNAIASQALQLGESNEEKIKRLEKRIEELESAA